MHTFRYALRSLARSPSFVTIAILALGVGLGLSTTMFAVMDTVVNPYVPYRDPDQLVTIWWRLPPRSQGITGADMYRALRDETRSFSAIARAAIGSMSLHRADGSDELTVERVTPAYFDVLGVKPYLGRFLQEGDEDDVVVLSHAVWRRLFGSRRSLDGATITLGDRTRTVIGVMPKGASGASRFASAWIPLDTGAVAAVALRPVARLRPGLTRDDAERELKAIADAITLRIGSRDPVGFNTFPVLYRSQPLRDIHFAMVGAALVVLLIACVNLAHLMLARGLAKRRELALRLALGATRATVVRQMFLECLLITAAGAGVGALLALWAGDVLANRMPPEISWIGLVQPQLSWRAFAIGGTAAALSAILFGLVPAIRVALNLNLDEPLKSDGGTSTGRHGRRYSPLVIAEVALALVLLMAGALLLRTVQQLEREAFAFDTRTLWRTWVMTRMRESPTDSAANSVSGQQVLDALRGIPGVVAVAYEGAQATRGGAITAEMVVGDPTRFLNRLGVPVVSAEYLRTLGLPILSGRDFEPGDVEHPVAIIDPMAAAVLYPNQDPVGKMIKLGAPASNAPWVEVVGVARNPTLLEGRDVEASARVWVSAPLNLSRWRGQFLVRSTAPDARFAVEVRRRMMAMPSVRGTFVRPYDMERAAALASRRFLSRVFVGMGSVALALAALGLYGVLAFAVNQRMREFAVRIALGAQPRQLFRMVLHDGTVMVLAGIGIGAFGALLATKYVDAVLEGVHRFDAPSLLGAELVLLAVGLAAALGPARRAVKANPMDILRAV